MPKLFWACIPFALLLLLAIRVRECRCRSVNSAVRVRFSEKGLEMAVNKRTDFLKSIILETVLPAHNGTSKTLLGKVNYSLSNGHINQFKMGQAKVKVNPENGVEVTIKDLEINASKDYSLRSKQLFINIEDQGKIMATVMDAALHISGFVVKSPKGGLMVTNVTCNSSLDNLNLSLTGKLSYIKGIVTYIARNRMKKALLEGLCQKGIDRITSAVNQKMSDWGTTKEIHEFMAINVSLLSNPLHRNGYLEFGVNGRFVNDTLDEIAPEIETPPLADILDVCVTDVVLNSALRVAQNRMPDVVETNITNPYLANMVYYASKFPELTGQAMTGVALRLSSRAIRVPTATVSESGIVETSQHEITVDVVKKDQSAENLNVVRLNLTVGLEPQVAGTMLYFSADKVNVSVQSVAVASSKDLSVSEILTQLVRLYIPTMNHFLMRGRAVKVSQNYQLVLAKRQFFNRYVCVTLSFSEAKPK